MLLFTWNKKKVFWIFVLTVCATVVESYLGALRIERGMMQIATEEEKSLRRWEGSGKILEGRYYLPRLSSLQA